MYLTLGGTCSSSRERYVQVKQSCMGCVCAASVCATDTGRSHKGGRYIRRKILHETSEWAETSKMQTIRGIIA